MPRRKDSDIHPAVEAAEFTERDSSEDAIGEGPDPEAMTKLSELWPFLDSFERQYIFILPICDSRREAMRRIGKGAIGSWRANRAKINPYFVRAEALRESGQISDKDAYECLSDDIAMLVMLQANINARKGAISEKEVKAVMSRRLSTPTKAKEVESNQEEELDVGNIVSFMPNG